MIHEVEIDTNRRFYPGVPSWGPFTYLAPRVGSHSLSWLRWPPTPWDSPPYVMYGPGQPLLPSGQRPFLTPAPGYGPFAKPFPRRWDFEWPTAGMWVADLGTYM